jgi:glycosyltransferase involved in cell wall biosynthesis
LAREGLAQLATLQRLEETVSPRGQRLDGRLAVSALEMGWYMKNQLLRDADWAGMAHSLEIRTPFVDVQLLREVAPWLAAHSGITKSEVAEAAVPSLRDDWLRRPKTGFNVPVRAWLGAQANERGLRPWALSLSQAVPAPPKHSVAPGREGALNVLMLVTDAYGGHGGIASYNRCLAEAIAGHPGVGEVTIVPRVMRFSAPATPPKVRFVAEGAGSKLRFVKAVWKLATHRFDVIFCGHLNLLPLAVPLGRMRGVPLIVQVHGIEAWKPPSRLTRWWLQHADAIWSVSGVTRDRMNVWAKLPPRRFHVIPNTFDPRAFGLAPKRPDLVERYGLAGCKVVLTLARLAGFERYKGIDEILDALPALALHDPTIRYVIVGDGDDEARLKRKAAELGVAQRVVFTGFVPEAEKADHLRLADAFALPGRGEGFGIVFLEAMACGIPVVGSRLDGSREALLDGRLGELANPDDLDSVRECIIRALAKPRQVPEGLATFEWPEFQRRVRDRIDFLLARAGDVRTAPTLSHEAAPRP